MGRKAILLMNVGTPDKPERKEVWKFLTEFLTDECVITLPAFTRFLLVNGIIIPFRLKKSTRLYRRLWKVKGSAIVNYTKSLADRLRRALPDEYSVFVAMRYGNPSVTDALKAMKEEKIDELFVYPLFPHYTLSTVETARRHVIRELEHVGFQPCVRFSGQFYNHPEFIAAFTSIIQKYQPEKYDYVLFSYHGIPLKHLETKHLPGENCETCRCAEMITPQNDECYFATCHETTRLLSVAVSLPAGKFGTSFQSRFARKWIVPFTEEVIVRLACQGKRKVLVVAPSFTADCLETIIEVGEEYRNLFLKNGGEELTLVESLNDRDEWVNALKEMMLHEE